jgi:hypothetical protein
MAALRASILAWTELKAVGGATPVPSAVTTALSQLAAAKAEAVDMTIRAIIRPIIPRRCLNFFILFNPIPDIVDYDNVLLTLILSWIFSKK